MTLSNKKFNISDIIKRIKSEMGLKTDSEVANLLGMQRTTLAERKRQNSVPYKEIVMFSDKENFNLSWLLYGEGAKYQGEKTMPGIVKESPAVYSEETLDELVERVRKIYMEGDFAEKAAIRGMIDGIYIKMIEKIVDRLKDAAEPNPALKKMENAG